MILVSYMIMCMIFGTTFVLIKVGLETGWAPFLFSSLRFFLAGGLVILFFLKKAVLPLKIHIRVVYVAFMMTTLPFAALYWGEQYISSGEAAVLVATSPLFILIINHLKGLEKIKALKAIGSFISMAGIMMVVFKDINLETNLDSLLAKFFLLFGEVAFALGGVESKKLLQGIKNPFVFNGFQMLYGGSMLFVLSLLFHEKYSVPTIGYGWIILLYFVLIASILSHGIFYWLIKKTNAFFPSTWTVVSPVLALMLGLLLFNENIGVLGFLGSFFILGGVLISNYQFLKIQNHPIKTLGEERKSY